MSVTPPTTGTALLPEPARLEGAAASWQRIRSIARRQRFVMQRAPHRLFDVTLWPLVDTLLFGSIGAYFASQSADPTAAELALGFMLVGTVLWHVVYQAQIALATGFLEETWSRNLLSIMVSPVREWEMIAGIAAFGLIKLALGVGAVAAVASFGYAFGVWSLGPEIIPVIAVLMVAGWAVGLLVIGFILRYGTGAEALAWGILFVVMPLSGVFYPLAALPDLVRPIAYLLPTTHAFAAGRSLLVDESPWRQLGLAALTTLLLMSVVLWFATRMLRVFRQRGYITRYS